MTTQTALSNSDPDVKAAKAKYAVAQKALGKDLGGFSLVDLLADNFSWPLAKCKEIAAFIKSTSESTIPTFKLIKEMVAEEQDDAEETSDEDEETVEDDGPQDVGSVAERQGFKKSKKEMYAFGKTRPVTLLTKDAPLGGLDVTYQYVINPKTGAWILRACLKGQTDADMVQFAQGDDPSSLVKNLKKKTKITSHQAVEFLNPPADHVSEDAKVYTIISTRHRDGRESSHTGTLEELIKSFSYTLEVGKSWQHEKGRKKINLQPKNIKSLIDNINNAANNAAANGAADRYYTLGKTESIKEALNEGSHDWGGKYPVDKYPTLKDVQKAINDAARASDRHNNDSYGQEHQLGKITLKPHKTGENDYYKIYDALLDKAEKWEPLLADKFKDKDGKEWWVVAGWLAESAVKKVKREPIFVPNSYHGGKLMHPGEMAPASIRNGKHEDYDVYVNIGRQREHIGRVYNFLGKNDVIKWGASYDGRSWPWFTSKEDAVAKLFKANQLDVESLEEAETAATKVLNALKAVKPANGWEKKYLARGDIDTRRKDKFVTAEYKKTVDTWDKFPGKRKEWDLYPGQKHNFVVQCEFDTSKGTAKATTWYSKAGQIVSFGVKPVDVSVENPGKISDAFASDDELMKQLAGSKMFKYGIH